MNFIDIIDIENISLTLRSFIPTFFAPFDGSCKQLNQLSQFYHRERINHSFKDLPDDIIGHAILIASADVLCDIKNVSTNIDLLNLVFYSWNSSYTWQKLFTDLMEIALSLQRWYGEKDYLSSLCIQTKIDIHKSNYKYNYLQNLLCPQGGFAMKAVYWSKLGKIAYKTYLPTLNMITEHKTMADEFIDFSFLDGEDASGSNIYNHFVQNIIQCKDCSSLNDIYWIEKATNWNISNNTPTVRKLNRLSKAVLRSYLKDRYDSEDLTKQELIFAIIVLYNVSKPVTNPFDQFAMFQA